MSQRDRRGAYNQPSSRRASRGWTNHVINADTVNEINATRADVPSARLGGLGNCSSVQRDVSVGEHAGATLVVRVGCTQVWACCRTCAGGCCEEAAAREPTAASG
jgi:hypothetical protein